MQPLEQEALIKEAASKGYGKLHAVFGGGLEGLRACAAGKTPPLSMLFSCLQGNMACGVVLEDGARHVQHGSCFSTLTQRDSVANLPMCASHCFVSLHVSAFNSRAHDDLEQPRCQSHGM